MPGRQFTQNPGPTNIPDRVLEAFRRPAVDFVDPGFIELVESIWDEMPALFDTAAGFICYTSVGHGAWEGTLQNIAEPGDRLLAPASGRFGILWGEMAANLGYKVDVPPFDMRRAPDASLVHDALVADRNHEIKAVLIAHTETGNGTVADLDEFRKAIDDADHPALFVVDAIASFATEALSMTRSNLDVVLASSQKGMMMPPGIAFCGLSERAVKHASELPTPRAYWSWPNRLGRDFIYQRFGGTPPEQHMYALRAALDLIAEEGGMPAVVERHRRLATAVHRAVETWGQGGPWEINAIEPAQRAGAITCVLTGDLDGDLLVSTARDRFNVSLGKGMPEMNGHAFRIGHLGDLNEAMILGALAAIEMTMTYLDMPFTSGVAAAADYLASTA